jgi:hypothetical protein
MQISQLAINALTKLDGIYKYLEIIEYYGKLSITIIAKIGRKGSR